MKVFFSKKNDRLNIKMFFIKNAYFGKSCLVKGLGWDKKGKKLIFDELYQFFVIIYAKPKNNYFLQSS